MMEAIRKWLNTGKNYQEGVQLYLQYGADRKLKSLFTQEGYSAFKEKILLKALTDLLSAEVPQPKPTIPSPAKAKAPEAKKSKWTPPDARTPTEDALHKQWQTLYSEMINLQAKVGEVARQGLTDPNKQEEAGRMALRILELDDLCEDIYEQRSYVQANGCLKPAVVLTEISLDPKLWHKRLANHQRYVREFRKRLAADPTNLKIAELLNKHEWAVKQYKQLLKME